MAHDPLGRRDPRLLSLANLNLPALGATILRMYSARIPVIVIVASSIASIATLSAQQDAGTHVTIQVTDSTGAPIPDAQVKVMSPENGRLLAFTADSRGIADLHLEPGEYQYRVSSRGFCPKNSTATIDTPWQQEIKAKLNVETCPGPCTAGCVTPIGVEPPGYQVTIKVLDFGGAYVSGALVEIDLSSPTFRAIKTDGSGQATIGIPTGMHSLRVSAPGFRNWNGFAEVQGTEEVITAKLRVAGTADPEISIESPGVDIPLYMPQPEFIALQPAETLPLPGVPARKHNRRY